MTLDFDRMPSLVQPRFKGGQGEAETRIFQDDMQQEAQGLSELR